MPRIAAYDGPLAVRYSGVRVEHGHGCEVEPEIADAREHAVQLGLVDDLASELGGAGAWHQRQAVEGRGEPLAEPPAP